MQNFLRRSGLVFLAVVFGALVASAYLKYSNHIPPLKSPIFNIPQVRVSDNVWFPKTETTYASQDESSVNNISAISAFFVDANTGQVLFEKNSREKLRIASLTKIMTAIVTLENRGLQEKLVVSERAAGMEPDKMLLIAGERLTVMELLQGLFLVSANDASEVFAEKVTGRREEFLNLMNSKAAQLGMKDTSFINPSGLEEDGKIGYSTAFDVAIMSRYAIHKYPELVNISSQPHIFIPETHEHQSYDLYTGINLISTYPGVKGFKTGYTPEAGLTLVTYAELDGKKVLGVLLGSTSRREDARELLDYSFKKLGVK